MIYRSAEKNDLVRIWGMLDASFDPVYAYYARKSFASPEDAVIAEEGNEIGGVINWRIFQAGDENLGYLFWLAVHPDHRRKGVGEGLVMEAVRHIHMQNGSIDIYAAVEKYNQPSRGLFEKLGFTPDGRSIISEKYGVKRLLLYSRMMLMPKEVLYLKRG